MLQAGEVPGGAILLVHKGEVIFKEAFGYGHIQKETPFTEDGQFVAASISKSIIATLIVKLAADEVVDLDQPIDEQLPIAKTLKLSSGERPMRTPTLRECLHHTAGFRSDEGPGTKPWLQWKHQGLTLAEVIEHEAEIPLSQNPGERYAYSGIGYDFAGRVVEVDHRKADRGCTAGKLMPAAGNEATRRSTQARRHFSDCQASIGVIAATGNWFASVTKPTFHVTSTNRSGAGS